MKNFKLTIAAAFLVATSSAFGQIENKWTLKKVNEVEMTNDYNETFKVKQIEVTEEITPAYLNPKDKNKVNQDIIFMPTKVYSKIKLDYDKDATYRNEVSFEYEKSGNYSLNFTLTKDGLMILTDKNDVLVSKVWDKSSKAIFSNTIDNRIKREGEYTIQLSNNEKVDVKISNYNIL